LSLTLGHEIIFFTKTNIHCQIYSIDIALFVMSHPFENESIMDWFLYKKNNILNGEKISLHGAIPFGTDVLKKFLNKFNYYDVRLGTNTDILIVGRKYWNKVRLEKLLDEKSGMSLKVYSQEMFLSYLASGRDPFSNKEILYQFQSNHPVLEYFSELGFDWPSTYVINSSHAELLTDTEWETIGVLKYYGYQVGENGLRTYARRLILDKVFNSNLPNGVWKHSYTSQWGMPKSPTRLKKMSNSLASFCKNQKKRNNKLAASHYESDLEWLKKKYYKKSFRFKWPSAKFIR